MNMPERIRKYGTYYGKVTIKSDKEALLIKQLNDEFVSSQFGNCNYFFLAKPDYLFKIGEAVSFSSRKSTYQNHVKCKTTQKIYNLLKDNPDLDHGDVWMVQTPQIPVNLIDPLFPEEGEIPLTVSTANSFEQRYIQKAYKERWKLEACNEVKR